MELFDFEVPLKYQYPTTGFEYEPPPIEYQYPTLEPWEIEPLPEPEYGVSLWDKFKGGVGTVFETIRDIAPDVGSFYAQTQGIKKPVDRTMLLATTPQPAQAPRLNYLMSTPYERSTSGAQPKTVTMPSAKAALPMPLILIGAGVLFFVIMKRR